MKTKCNFEEDRCPLLLLSDDGEKLRRYPLPVCETAVTKGAVNYMGQWPSHVFAAFVAACLVFATFVLFALIAAIFSSIPSPNACRQLRNIEFNGPPNVYFVKHENRTWTQNELCYIETAARDHPNLSVYLINLLTGEPRKDNANKLLIRPTDTEDEGGAPNESIDLSERVNDSLITRNTSPEGRTRQKLASQNPNIKNINVTVEHFFEGSRLSAVCKSLNRQMVEMAARAYILWNYPGVALDPAMYSSLGQLQKFLCKDANETCKPAEREATVELKGDLQASAVPCQAFVGYLIREIATGDLPDQECTLKQALHEFCPRSQRCAGVKVMSLRPSEARSNLHCPTIYPSGIPGQSYVTTNAKMTKD